MRGNYQPSNPYSYNIPVVPLALSVVFPWFYPITREAHH